MVSSEKELAYWREYRKRPEVVARKKARLKRLRLNPAYRAAYNKAREGRRKKAQHYIRNRVAKGKLTRPPCIFCGKPNALAHHEDYSKPLDVVWVCHAHHVAIHAGKIKIKEEHISHVE